MDLLLDFMKQKKIDFKQVILLSPAAASFDQYKNFVAARK